MALASLRQSFLNGSLTRLVDSDSTLKSKIVEFVTRGDFGLASGKKPDGAYERIWFKEEVPADKVAFEPGVFLLRKATAELLRKPSLSVTVSADSANGLAAELRQIPQELGLGDTVRWNSRAMGPNAATSGGSTCTTGYCSRRCGTLLRRTPRASPKLSQIARTALGVDTAPQLRGLQDAHRANLSLHRTGNRSLPSTFNQFLSKT